MADTPGPSTGSMTAKVILSQIRKDLGQRIGRRLPGRDPLWPWMKPREIEIVLDLLAKLRPRRVLEWGAGSGTLYFTRAYSEFETWTSIEHVEHWAEKLNGMIKDPRVEIVHVEAGDPGPPAGESVSCSPDGTYAEFKEYVEYPATLAAFDLILVDGRARSACLQRAPACLNGRGVLVLHDACRAQYHPLPAGFADSILFQDYRTEGGLWVASEDKAVAELIDLAHHLPVWRFYRRFGRLINLLYGPGICPRWREVL